MRARVSKLIVWPMYSAGSRPEGSAVTVSSGPPRSVAMSALIEKASS